MVMCRKVIIDHPMEAYKNPAVQLTLILLCWSLLGVGLVDPRDILEKVRQSATVHGRPNTAHCPPQKDRTGKVSNVMYGIGFKKSYPRVTMHRALPVEIHKEMLINEVNVAIIC